MLRTNNAPQITKSASFNKIGARRRKYFESYSISNGAEYRLFFNAVEYDVLMNVLVNPIKTTMTNRIVSIGAILASY